MSDRNTGTETLIVKRLPASTLSVSSLVVEVLEGPDRGSTHLEPGQVIHVGSHPDNHLVLTDPGISRRHVLFRGTPEGIVVEDRGSKNGTWLGATRLNSALVTGGSEIRIGSTLLRVSLQAESWRIQPRAENHLGGMRGTSQPMREVFGLIEQVAKFDTPVLVTGETGTGKELAARAIHESGARAAKRLVVLDCGSIVKDLLKSELFGHEKGAYTGADQRRTGIFEEADGGTVVLDEIGEIDLSIQPQLLRVLETREVKRLGSSESRRVDFRLVSSTNRDLQRMCDEGTFRRDLYYRLSAITIQLPPLRARPGDIASMVEHFLQDFGRRNRIAPPAVTPRLLEALEAHAWPGNVRELKNVVESLCVRSRGQTLDLDHLQNILPEPTPSPTSPGPRRPRAPLRSGFRDRVPDFEGDLFKLGTTEKELILAALRECGWNRKLAAEKLGISRTTLYERIARYQLMPDAGGDPGT